MLGLGACADDNKGMWRKSGHIDVRPLYVQVGGRQIKLPDTGDEKGHAGRRVRDSRAKAVDGPTGLASDGVRFRRFAKRYEHSELSIVSPNFEPVVGNVGHQHLRVLRGGAGLDEEHVERAAGEARGDRGDLAAIGDVELLDLDAAGVAIGEVVEIGADGPAHRADDVPVARKEFGGESEAENAMHRR